MNDMVFYARLYDAEAMADEAELRWEFALALRMRGAARSMAMAGEAENERCD